MPAVKTTQQTGPSAFEAVILWLEKAAVYGGIFIFPFFTLPGTRDTINLPKQVFLQSLVGMCFVLWLWRVVREKKIVWQRTVGDWPILVLTAIVLVSTITSLSPAISLFGHPHTFTLSTINLLSWFLWFALLTEWLARRGSYRGVLLSLLLGGGVAMGIFLLSDWPFISRFIFWIGGERVISANILLGVFYSTIGVLAAGLFCVADLRRVWRFVSLVVFILSVVTLLQLGFAVAWIVLAVGLGLQMFFLVTVFSTVRGEWAALVCFIFLLAGIMGIAGTPRGVKRVLPVEVALGARATWDLVLSAHSNSPRYFFVGSGPATFSYVFSRWRTPAYNFNEFTANTRFTQGFNTLLTMLIEYGGLAVLAFLFLIVSCIGALSRLWREERLASKRRSRHVTGEVVNFFAGGAAFGALTVGLFLSFFDLTLWFVWWTLVVVSLSASAAAASRKVFNLFVSPQHRLAGIFGLVCVLVVGGIYGLWAARLYMAEIAFTNFLNGQSVTSEKISVDLERAVEWRPAYAPYGIALVKAYLERAAVLAKAADSRTGEIPRLLSSATERVKILKEAEPRDVEVWETAAVVYANT
ncbi:MAG: hypothetical protein HY984_01985, partial [Candidatus Magasanikbacteria bacterium]|nr:hypothetical protein [Candidatus Magasanikbacteria bacterium]